MTPDPQATEPLKPLKIKCTSSSCSDGLHCFRETRKMAALNQAGRCRTCGAELVDWQRVRNRNLNDVAYTFSALRLELIRHHFWHVEIDEDAVRHARRKGMSGMRVAVEKRIRKYVGPPNPSFDGRQTPKSGNAVFYAQHATASCCRPCIQEWHGIARDQELTDAEIEYLASLAMRYVAERMPYLTTDGERIAPRRSLRR